MTDLEVYNEWKELDDYFHAGSDEWARDDEAYERHCRKCERYAYLRSEIYRRFKERAEKEATP